MKLNSALTRRSFLQTALGLAALGWLQPLRALQRISGWHQPDPLAPRLTAMFTQPASAAVVGQAYLRATPEETHERRLVSLVCRQLAGGRTGVALGDRASLREQVREAQRQDFANGRVVQVEGWVLARTEARLCALAALRRTAA